MKAKIINKEIVFPNIIYAHQCLAKFEGLDVIVTVEKPSNKRSDRQNRYYWECIGYISDYTGHTPEELHRLFKGLFLPKKEVEFNGKKYTMSGSTTDLTVGQFVEYMMRISAEVATMGITLPSPVEYDLETSKLGNE